MLCKLVNYRSGSQDSHLMAVEKDGIFLQNSTRQPTTNFCFFHLPPPSVWRTDAAWAPSRAIDRGEGSLGHASRGRSPSACPARRRRRHGQGRRAHARAVAAEGEVRAAQREHAPARAEVRHQSGKEATHEWRLKYIYICTSFNLVVRDGWILLLCTMTLV